MVRSGTATVTLPSDREILITRQFDAPRHLVYQAWTTPELVKRWWSSDMGETTVAEIDLRVGGRWRYVMVTGDGFEVAFHGEYREVVPNERVVFTEVYEGIPQEEGKPEEGALVTVDFAEADGRTTLTMLVETSSRESRDAIIDSGMETGLQKSMDYLERVANSLR